MAAPRTLVLAITLTLMLPVAAAAAPLSISGTTFDDRLVVTATGVDGGSYSLNGGLPVAFSDVSSLSFRGGDGSDTCVIVNPAGGLLAPSGGIECHGGDQPPRGLDTLVVRGGSSDAGRSLPGATPDAGTIEHTLGSVTQAISYTGLEPVVDTTAAASFTINASGAAETVTLDDGVAAADGRLRVTPGAAESIEFANKTTVTVNGLGGNDTFNVSAGEPATGLASISFATGAQAGDVVNVGALTLPGVGVAFTATNGSIVDANSAALNVRAQLLGLSAGTGIASAADPLETEVDNLEATTATGGVSVSEADAVTIGGVAPGLTGYRATAGDVSLTAGGSITLTDTGGAEAVRGAGNVTLTANGAAADITRPADADAVTSAGGSVTLTAGRDILLGTAGTDFDNDVRARNALTLAAGRDIVVDGFADIVSDAAGANTGGSLTASAGRDVTVARVQGTDGSLTALGTASADVLVSAAGTATFDGAPPASAVSQSGDVSVSADRIVISANTGLDATAGSVFLGPSTAGRAVDVGSAVDTAASTLEISDAEIDRVEAVELVLGAPDAGLLSVTAVITTPGSVGTLSLVSGGGITATGAGTIAEQSLGFADGSASGRRWALVPGGVQMTGLAAVPYTSTTTLVVEGGAGADTFDVDASDTTAYTIIGNAPATAPGDTLNYDDEGRGTSGDATPPDGAIDSPTVQPVTFSTIETVNLDSDSLIAGDNCPALTSPDQTDSEGDGIGDLCDPDDDNDGAPDATDNCPLANPDQLNTDGDAQGNACDPDDDNDGRPDGADNCPLAANADQLNVDGDALGDLCDLDDDTDGVRDTVDNCRTVVNPAQIDGDRDGLGRACDPDDFVAGLCANLFVGTNAGETLLGSAKGDRMSGLGGNDTLRGLGGDDCLEGGAGNDALSGGAGNDRVSGGAGRDRVYGSSGNDRLIGGAGADRLSGSAGADRLSGGAGGDRLTGGSGNDRLTGGAGRNSYNAGPGNDRISARNRVAERVRCGRGRDTATVDRRDRVIDCERVRRR